MILKETVKKRIVNINYEKIKISWYYYIPLLLIAGFVPLIVYGKYVDLTGTTQALYWTGQNQLLDFFSYWKSRWVIFLTVTALIIYILLFISKKLPFKKVYQYYIPLAMYSLFVILSTIFAVDVPTALNGFIDMYQGMWVLLSYVAITFLVINFVNSERDVKLFLYAFIFLIIVEGLLGVGQYFGFDIFNTKLGNSLIIPSGVQVDGGLTFNFGKHTIYGTLFNTNFVGSFVTLMLPITVVFLVNSKTFKRRIIACFTLLLCLFTWIGCNSRAGYISIVITLFVTLVLFNKYIVKYWKYILMIILICLIIFFILNLITDNLLVSRIKLMNPITAIKNITYNNTNRYINIENIEIEDKIIVFKTSNEILKIKIENDKVLFLDESNKILEILDENGYITINDERYNKYKITIPVDLPIINVKISELWKTRDINFYLTEDEIKVLGVGNRIEDIYIAPYSELFEGIEEIASSRGYIWGRSIPLLNRFLYIGAGADNFVYVFPQNDYIGKLNVGMKSTTVVDKPHNMYLQIAINTGVVSLVILLILWAIYIVSSVKLYCNTNLDSLDKHMGLACLLSVVGYLVAGVFNDYIVSVAPLFWITLGLGISINIRVKRNEDVNV